MDKIKTLQLILDNPANNLTITSRDLIETLQTTIKLEQEQEKNPPLTLLLKAMTNGEERYHKDPVFNNIVRKISNGLSFIEALDQVLLIQMKTSDQLAKYMMEYGYMVPNKSDEEE